MWVAGLRTTLSLDDGQSKPFHVLVVRRSTLLNHPKTLDIDMTSQDAHEPLSANLFAVTFDW